MDVRPPGQSAAMSPTQRDVIITSDDPIFVYTAPTFSVVNMAEVLAPVIEDYLDIWLPILLPPYIQPAVDAAVAALAVLRAGDTMTGPLMLTPTIPTANPMAASKLYVDLQVATSTVPEVPVNPIGQSWERMTGAWVAAGTAGIPEPVGAGVFGRTSAAVWQTVLPITGGTLTGALNLPIIAPTLATQSTHKQYVDDRDAILQGQIDVLAENLFFVGQINVATDAGTYTTASGLTNGPLPAPAAGNRGYYVIVNNGGTPPAGNIPPGTYAAFDWLVSDGTTWTHLMTGVAAVIAPQVALSPLIPNLGANVQTALQYLETNKITQANGDARYLQLSGGTVTGDIIMTGAATNLLVPNGTLAAPSLSIGTADTGFYRVGATVGLTLAGTAAWLYGAGITTTNADLNMAGNQVTNLGNPLAATDALNLQTGDARYMNIAGTGFLPLTGGALAGPGNLTIAGTLGITGLVTSAASINLAATALPAGALPALNTQHISMPAPSRVLFNAWTDGTAFTYRAAGGAGMISYDETGQQMAFSTAVTGAAGAAVPFTAAFYADAANNLVSSHAVMALAGGFVGSWDVGTNTNLGFYNDFANGLLMFGDADGQGTPTAARATLSAAGVFTAAAFQVGDNTFALSRTAPFRALTWLNGGWQNTFNEGTGLRSWNAPAGLVLMTLDGAGFSILGPANVCFRGGNTAWDAVSDQRVKRDVADYTTGLDQVCALRPVSYYFNGEGGTTDDGSLFIGLVAQEALPVMPEIIRDLDTLKRGTDGAPLPRAASMLPGMLGMNPSALTFALCNAVRELRDMIDAGSDEGTTLPARIHALNDRVLAMEQRMAAVSAAMGIAH